jgi:hypothetical protein
MLTNIIAEVGSLWSWITGVIAGLGVTATVLILGFVMVYIKLKRIHDRLQMIHNQSISETRDLSLRINKLEQK